MQWTQGDAATSKTIAALGTIRPSPVAAEEKGMKNRCAIRDVVY